MVVSMPEQGIMENITGAEGEEDADVEVVAVQGDEEVNPVCKPYA
jgi:hypothetical protein